MSEVKWIKIVTDIFDDEKILLIETLPDADSIIVIWFKLLTLGGKQNNSGVFMFNHKIPYTDEMLATIFRRNVNTVRLALTTFEKYGMIEIINGAITIPNWSKHQNLDQIESRNEYMKDYMAKYRKKQKLIAQNSNSKVNSKVNGKVNVNSLDIEEDIEEDIDINNIILSDNIICGISDENTTKNSKFKKTFKDIVVEEWNKLKDPITKISTLKKDTQRYKMLNQRVSEYGENKVLEAIEKIKQSSFLQGNNNKGWTITFEWFVRPNNFVKVLEGNYADKKIQKSKFIKGRYIEQKDILSEKEKAERLKNERSGTLELLERY